MKRIHILGRKNSGKTTLIVDLVLVEGDLKATAPRVEVWREIIGQPPITANDPSIAAIISDDAIDIKLSIWKRNNIEAIGERVLRLTDSVYPERKPSVWQ